MTPFMPFLNKNITSDQHDLWNVSNVGYIYNILDRHSDDTRKFLAVQGYDINYLVDLYTVKV